LTGITDIGGSSTLQSLTYGYYPTNNVQTITNAVASNQNTGSANMSYGYGTGSDLLASLSMGGTVVQTIGYTADGRIASMNPGIQAPAGQYITSLSYNQDGRLAAVNAGGGALASYIYDGFEQRLVKTVSGSYGEIYQYSQDGALLEETNASGVAQADYIYLNGWPIAVLNGSTLYYLHDDRLGTPQVATDGNQAVQWQASYDAFGQASVSGTVTQNLRFPGQYFDVESGWNHNGFRDYAPQLSRYLEPDPLGRLGSGNNLYVYAGDNPTNLTDPLGLCPKCFAQLKTRPVDDWRAKLVGATHSFWYVQGSSGTQYIISGGPWPINGHTDLDVWVNQNLHSGVDNVSSTTSWNSGLSSNNCSGVDNLINTANNWPQNTIPYNPQNGPNSNSAAHNLGTAGGFSPPAPPGSIGWNTPIP
jgi:RHS repeat-associated protein